MYLEKEIMSNPYFSILLKNIVTCNFIGETIEGALYLHLLISWLNEQLLHSSLF